ncbi:MAG TPA: hypothetical protein VGA52_15365 [Anaerolineales bacterium]|jgi:hypothetical protein
MRRYLNAPRIQRNHNTGRFMVFSGLALLAGGFIYSLRNQEEVNLVLLIAVLGTLTAQFGLAMINRWGKSPREDERLDAAVKGLDDRWATLHYAGPTNHILIGPAGIFALVARADSGQLNYEDGSGWSQDRPPGGLLRRGGLRQLRGVTEGATSAARNVQVLLDNHLESETKFQARPLLIFLHDEADLRFKPEQAPIPAVHFKKVKDWLRKQPKADTLSPETTAELAEALGLAQPQDE